MSDETIAEWKARAKSEGYSFEDDKRGNVEYDDVADANKPAEARKETEAK